MTPLPPALVRLSTLGGHHHRQQHHPYSSSAAAAGQGPFHSGGGNSVAPSPASSTGRAPSVASSPVGSGGTLPGSGGGRPLKDVIVMAPCGAREVLPSNPDLPADLFTSCLTTPMRRALRWFVRQNKVRRRCRERACVCVCVCVCRFLPLLLLLLLMVSLVVAKSRCC